MVKVTIFNVGQRGFILPEGQLFPQRSLTISEESAKRLEKMYPGEIKVVGAQNEPEAEVKTAEVAEVKKAKKAK